MQYVAIPPTVVPPATGARSRQLNEGRREPFGSRLLLRARKTTLLHYSWSGSVGARSSDPKPQTETTSPPPAASTFVASVERAAQKRPKEALPKKSAGPFAKRSPADENENLPPRKPSARVLRNANKQKDNPDMTARTARRISQPDSRCVPNRNAVLNKKNVVALPPLPLAQLHPRNALPRVSLAARIRKAGRILTAPLPPLQPWLFSTKNGVDAPLPLAQLHPRNALPRDFRGQNPKGRSVLDRTACAASFRASPRRVGVCVLQSARSEVNRRYRD